MKALMHWVTENEAVLTMMTALLTFFLGRYTSYREDYREGRKEINDTFYKPFLELYDNEHHSMAWYYTDLSLEMQNSIMEILLTNRYKVHPRIKNKIYELDMYFSSRISPLSRDKELVDEEKEYVEKVFQSIYSYSNKVSSFLAFFFCLDYTNFIFFS
ncbi:hypothetical protein [Sellimonas catena]|nr:hypothetical protein [Sellimonas catena]